MVGQTSGQRGKRPANGITDAGRKLLRTQQADRRRQQRGYRTPRNPGYYAQFNGSENRP